MTCFSSLAVLSAILFCTHMIEELISRCQLVYAVNFIYIVRLVDNFQTVPRLKGCSSAHLLSLRILIIPFSCITYIVFKPWYGCTNVVLYRLKINIYVSFRLKDHSIVNNFLLEFSCSGSCAFFWGSYICFFFFAQVESSGFIVSCWCLIA